MTIRPRKSASGNKSWQLDCGIVNGKRLQLSFKTKGKAEGEMSRRLAELARAGKESFELTHMDRLAFIECRNRLAKVGANIIAATDFFLAHARPSREPVALEKLFASAIDAKSTQGKSDRYLSQLKCVAKGFCHAGHSLTLCHQITRPQVEDWLKSGRTVSEGKLVPWSAETWNTYLVNLAALFQWGIDEKYLTINPCHDIRHKSKDTPEEIHFLTVDEVAALFRRAESRPNQSRMTTSDLPAPSRKASETFVMHGGQPIRPEDEDFSDFIPLLTVAFFCGLRPERELGKLTMDDVCPGGEPIVIVQAKRAKTRQRRTVDLPPNALHWLAAFPKTAPIDPHTEKVPITPPNFVKRWRRLRKQAGITDWPHDGTRHTFATYHYAHFKNEVHLQTLMGHESAAMLHQHYRGLATPNQAVAFWSLFPLCGPPWPVPTSERGAV